MDVLSHLDSIKSLYFPPTELKAYVEPEEDDFEHIEHQDVKESIQTTPSKATPMYSRQTEVVWPIINAPELDLFSIAATTYSAKAPNTPVAALSVSSIFLETAAQLRDLVLSFDDRGVAVGFAKLAAVTTITLTAVALFEASNITEIAIRAMIFSCTYGFTAAWILTNTLDIDTEEMFGELVHAALDVGAGVNLLSLAGMVHGVFIDILTPIVFTCHMLYNTESNMPHIGVITNQATLTLQDTVFKFFHDLQAAK